MIQILKETPSDWCVWNDKNNKCANISKIFEYNAFSKPKSRFRVDANGFTIASMINNFQTARGIAIKAVKEA